jgi:hypothetical protein
MGRRGATVRWPSLVISRAAMQKGHQCAWSCDGQYPKTIPNDALPFARRCWGGVKNDTDPASPTYSQLPHQAKPRTNPRNLAGKRPIRASIRMLPMLRYQQANTTESGKTQRDETKKPAPIR